MIKFNRILPGAALVLFGVLLGQAAPVQAQLDKVLKGGLILLAVDKFGPDINKFVNEVTGTRDEGDKDMTKVVPILSIGGGTYAGAAQVMGPRRLVETVKAVAQLQAEKTIIQPRVRVTALIPVSDRTVRTLDSLKRVPGVGISGTLEVKL